MITSRTARRLAMTGALLLPVLAAGAGGGRPSASCDCRLVGDRVVASVEVVDLVDPALERLIRLDLEGHLVWELEIVRKRWLLFEQRVATRSVSSSVRFSRDRRRFELDGRNVGEDLGRLTLHRVTLGFDQAFSPEGSYELRARVRLRVVTAASLGRVASWMADDERAEEHDSSWMARGIVTAVSNDLQRAVTARCPVAHGPSASEPAAH